MRFRSALKRRRDLGFPVIESQLPGAALQHAVGQVAGKDAAARDARQSSRLLKNAEFVKTPRDAKMKQAGTIAAARQRQPLSAQSSGHDGPFNRQI
jgi:hypothetical protein